MNNLHGLGMYIWKVTVCEAGDLDAIVRVAKEARLTHVLIKIANWNYAYNVSSNVPLLCAKLKAAGITPLGWHYVYGSDPVGEANIAKKQVAYTGVEGYVIDAEGEYKLGRTAAARTFMANLKGINVPVGLSSFRYPTVHPELPWREFLTGCQFVMPQVYWMGAHDPAYQLRRTVTEYANLYKKLGLPHLPVYPTGAAFSEHGWTPTAADVAEFLGEAVRLGLPAANFWEWWHTRARQPHLWHLIANYPWPALPGSTEPTQPMSLEARLDRLEREAYRHGWDVPEPPCP